MNRIVRLATASPAALILLSFLAATLPFIILRPLWYDELCTRFVAISPDLPSLWVRLYNDGVDPSPPLMFLAFHASLRLFGDTAFGLRFPSVLGFGVALYCLFRFTAHRLGHMWGYVASAFLLCNGVIYYSREARAYGLVLGVTGIAMIAWQRYAESERRRDALTLIAALIAATSIHYYAVLFSVPLFFAEAARLWQRRRFDLWTIPILAAPSLTVVAHLPLIRAVAAHPAHNNTYAWSHASYGFPARFWLLGVEPVVTALLILAAWAFLTRQQTPEENPPRAFTIPEMALIAGLLLLPWAALVFGKLVTKVAVPRYALGGFLGFSLAATVLVARLVPRQAVWVLLLLCGFVNFYSILDIRQLQRYAPTAGNLNVPAIPDLPVVVDDYLRIAQLSHYGDPSLVSRLYYLTDLERIREFTESGQMELLTGHAIRLGVFRGNSAEVGDFLKKHRRFLLVTPTNPDPYEGWMPRDLLARGVRLSLLDISDGRWYLAEVP